MDAPTTAAAKAVGVAPSADAGSTPSSQRSAAPKPVPRQEEEALPAAAADMAPPTATASTTTTSAESCGEDEQVEKFYALLANIRAMRGMYARGRGDAGASTDDTAGEVCNGGGRKRARWAEQPWRPAFRMEDFEEAPGGSASEKDMRDGEGAATRRPGRDTTDEAVEDESDDARRKGRREVVTSSSQRKV